ncbi:MAG: YdbC family protein [Treponema sp.]|nr:YdbC family protein [Treponema sp.]
MADEFSFEITEKIAVISTSKGGWTLELNKVSWGGRPAKYDLRSWSPDHQKMGKGVTLSDEELNSLKNTLNSL